MTDTDRTLVRDALEEARKAAVNMTGFCALEKDAIGEAFWRGISEKCAEAIAVVGGNGG